MKKIITGLILVLYSWQAAASCDWSLGITQAEGGYLYTTDCHRQVGKLVQDQALMKDQLADYKLLVDEHKKMLDLYKNQVDFWRGQVYNQKWEKVKSDIDCWIWFVGGIVLMGTATWLAGQTN